MILDRPYLYVKSPSAGMLSVYYYAELTAGYSVVLNAAGNQYSMGPDRLNPLMYTIEIIIQSGFTTPTPNRVEGRCDLSKSVAFDPSTTKFIEVRFIESDNAGNYRLKGRGTTTQEDADSSDDE